MNGALSQAVYALGFRWSEPSPAKLAVATDVAAARIDRALRQTQAQVMHLCPLDLGDDVPQLRFGPNRIRTFTAEELDDLLDPDGLERARGGWRFDSRSFCQFSWLVVEETVAIAGNSGIRALPEFSFDALEDFGRIEPHKRRYPAAVEEALFALPFHLPWVYTISDDLLTRRRTPPEADTLSWEPASYENDDGETVEYERPGRLSLYNDAASEAAYLDDGAWEQLQEARRSPLFAGPILHFVIRAFASDGIDELLAQITVIEAALGMPIDHKAGQRPKQSKKKDPGATARVAARLSALLNDPSASERYRALFKERSDFLHGQTMKDISSLSRLDARRLARQCVCALVGAAITAPRPANQDLFLAELLQSAWSTSA
jgi:hypothetical protein